MPTVGALSFGLEPSECVRSLLPAEGFFFLFADVFTWKFWSQLLGREWRGHGWRNVRVWSYLFLIRLWPHSTLGFGNITVGYSYWRMTGNGSVLAAGVWHFRPVLLVVPLRFCSAVALNVALNGTSNISKCFQRLIGVTPKPIV